jgi:hypothetical protein
MEWFVANRSWVETALERSGERTHKMLAAVYGDVMQPEFIKDGVYDLYHYLDLRQMEPPVRELSEIFGYIVIEGELRAACDAFRRGFSARKPRKATKIAPEASYLSWQQ